MDIHRSNITINTSKLIFRMILFICLIGLGACASNQYRKINRAHEKSVSQITESISEKPKTRREFENDSLAFVDQWIGTTNFSIRRPNYVVIHHTAQDSLEQTIKTFTLPRTQVSSHYVIGDDGTIVQMLNDYLRSWHAGSGSWGNDTDLNSASIGIELDNDGSERFSDAQIQSLLLLLKRLKETYRIPTANFIGHSDIAPGRKVDPSIYFPWKRLADEGYGLWYDEILNTPDFLSAGIPPENFNSIDALRIIGYNVSDPDAAIQSFKLHFIQRDFQEGLNEYDKLILYNLYQKYR